MKKHFKKILWLTPVLLFCLYWLGIYLSLKIPWMRSLTLKMEG